MQWPTTPRWRSAYSRSSPGRCISRIVWYQTVIRASKPHCPSVVPFPTLLTDYKRLPAEALQIDQTPQMGLCFRKWPRAASQPRIALAPINIAVEFAQTCDFLNGVEIHFSERECTSIGFKIPEPLRLRS